MSILQGVLADVAGGELDDSARHGVPSRWCLVSGGRGSEEIGDRLEAGVVEDPGSMPPSHSMVVPLMKSRRRHTGTRRWPDLGGLAAAFIGTRSKYSRVRWGRRRAARRAEVVGDRRTQRDAQLTRICGPHSCASERVMWLRPDLAAP